MLPLLQRPYKNRNDLADETIVAEIRLKSNKKVFLVLTYRTPSKSSVIEIDNFCNSMSQIIDKMNEENPMSIILMGDFNGRSPVFWEHETVENAAWKTTC